MVTRGRGVAGEACEGGWWERDVEGLNIWKLQGKAVQREEYEMRRLRDTSPGGAAKEEPQESWDLGLNSGKSCLCWP